MATAYRVFQQEGLERVTMRRLAQELDTGPASLYVYVRGTAELHGALLDELLAGLDAPSGPAGPADTGPDGWREQVVDLLTAFTVLLMPVPGLARSVLLLRPTGPRYLGLVDAVLASLLAGGVPVRQAAWGVDRLLQLATATAAEQGSRDESVETGGEDDALTLAVGEVPAEEYPSITAVRSELLSGTGAQRLRWAFTALLAGIAATAAPAPHHDDRRTP